MSYDYLEQYLGRNVDRDGADPYADLMETDSPAPPPGQYPPPHVGTPWQGAYLNAYFIAVKHGYTGTEEEWLRSLQGMSVYEAAVLGGYTGTEQELIELLGNAAMAKAAAEAAQIAAENAAADAAQSAEQAEDSSEDAEAWAVGQRGGVDVLPGDPTYENNAKYYAEHGQPGTVDYEELENRPSINGVELIGDRTFEDLGISGALTLRGTSTTALTDGSTTNPITLSDDTELTAVAGDVVFYGEYEFAWNGSRWEKLGGDGDYVLTTDSRLSDARTPLSHAHGNVTSAGAITATGVTIANNDALVISDASDSSKLVKTSIVFDGSTTSQALTKKGTWGTFITSETSLSKTDSGSGNAVTALSVSGHAITVTKGATFVQTSEMTTLTNTELETAVATAFTNVFGS